MWCWISANMRLAGGEEGVWKMMRQWSALKGSDVASEGGRWKCVGVGVAVKEVR